MPVQAPHPRRVLILSTGGTLGMRSGVNGPLEPGEMLEDLLTWIPELRDYAEIEVEILINIDSSLMEPAHWLMMARRIQAAERESQFAGIVILHGTDSLSYSASALSFLLPRLSLPVVLTGGQRPLAATRTDARNNILGAVESALEGPVEVMVFFHHRAFRGNRTTKIAIGDFDGFDSPNFPPLGHAGIAWEWNRTRFWPESKRPSVAPPLPAALPDAPLVIPWIPGLDFAALRPALCGRWALVLEAFGAGNMPLGKEAAACLQAILDEGGLVFVRSQVPRGRTDLNAYQPGKALADAGIAGGGDMTREAMVTKLMVLKGAGHSCGVIKRHMARPLAGELTPVTGA